MITEKDKRIKYNSTKAPKIGTYLKI